MKHSILAMVATVALGTGAHSASITVTTFSFSEFNGLKQGNAVVEDFETPGNLTYEIETPSAFGDPLFGEGSPYGELAEGSSLGSSVGTFTGLGTGGGTPSGSTCTALDVGSNGCENIGLQYDPPLNAQGNVVPLDGSWSLNALDTLGMVWEAFLPDDKRFNSLFFAIRDVGDQGAEFEVSADGSDPVKFSDIFSAGELGDGNEKLVFIDFGGSVKNATIRMSNVDGGSRLLNDSFTVDGATINPVPLPAPALLLLGGLGLMAGLRRRRKAA